MKCGLGKKSVVKLWRYQHIWDFLYCSINWMVHILFNFILKIYLFIAWNAQYSTASRIGGETASCNIMFCKFNYQLFDIFSLFFCLRPLIYVAETTLHIKASLQCMLEPDLVRFMLLPLVCRIIDIYSIL
jgi:hypothetical protein